MAFNLEVLRGTVSYNMYDGNPFSFDEADLGGASVRNIEERGPYQDGATHLAERLEPDVTTLRIFVKAATDALLDGHRDTLNKAFKPIPGVPITLKLTRDDGAVRHQDTRRTGRLSIPLVKELRPGHTHKAVVQLRAADPTWYDPDEQEEDFSPPSAQWWLAFNTIGTANVLEHAQSPTAGQLWTNSGSAAAGSPWTIFFRSANPGTAAAQQYAFQTFEGVTVSAVLTNAFTDPTAVGLQAGGVDQGSVNAFAAGTANYFMQTNGGTVSFYQDTTLFGPYTSASGTAYTSAIPGTAQGTAVWRDRTIGGRSWPVALPYAAAYNIALTAIQRNGIVLSVAGSAFPVALVYAGDVDSYPVITITGPLANPVLTNLVTGDTLDFTGGTVGSADTWTIDTRYGRKSVLNASGSSVANYLSDASDLATFRLVSDPIAPGGTNTITMGGSAQGTAAAATLSWYNRYLSY